MTALRIVSASVLDGLAWLLDWPPVGLRKLATVLRGGGQGEENKVGGTD